MNKEIKIDRQSILNAIKMIDEDPELLKGRSSFMYDLIYENKTYPPILILSIANKLNGGEELVLNDFGGTEKPFKILKDLEFDIIKKNEEFTMRLRPKELIKYIFNTNLENIEKSILAQNKGLSALCLLYKTKMTHQELSELFGDNVQFNNISTASVPEFIKEISRYCDVNIASNNQIYDNIEEDDSSLKLIQFESFEIEQFSKNVYEAGLKIPKELITRFVSSLLTKPFVLLTGLSGSGKTKIAQSFVQWICEDENQYKIVPVGADWTNREPLLGYPNGLKSSEYISPDSDSLDIIIEASKIENSDKPYFLILDEMNLSHVERYFADFLSVMESGDNIKLYSGSKRKDLKGNEIPNEISLPKNLFIIGTVNIDETTYMFSPKVLDRANTIEFRIDETSLKNFFDLPSKIDLSVLKRNGIAMSKNFLEISQNNSIENDSEITKIFIKFFNELKKAGAEFGYRTSIEMLILIKKMYVIGVHNKNECVDIAIMQKLLPKLHGSRNKISKVLDALILLCLKEGETFSIAKSEEVLTENILYPISYEKLVRMYKNALDNGFTSYAEA